MIDSLPKGWVRTRLEDIINVRNGFAFESKDYQDNGILLIRQSNLGRKKIGMEKAVFLPEEYLQKYANFIVEKGDILVGMSGSIGKLSVYDFDYPALQNQRTGLVIFFEPETKQYIQYYFETLEARFITMAKGVAVQNISATQIKSSSVFLPPLPEQHRIVAKIEELFTKLDAGIESLGKIQLQLKRYRQSVLKSAFEGNLTKEWREAHTSELEPAAALLEHIRGERKKKLGVKYKELPPVDRSKLPELPEGWVWTTPSRIADIRLGKMLDKNKNRGNLMPYLRNLNVRWNEFDLSDLLDMRFEPHEVERFQVKSSDALVCEGGEPGRAAVWQAEGRTIQYQKALHRVRPLAGISAKWIVYSLWKDSLSKALQQYFTGSTIMHFTGESFDRYVFPIAPLIEQSKVIAEVDLQMSAVDETENVIDHELKRAERLRQSILKRAFEGKLVPQDPSDEPADKLLERIKTEKAKQAINGKKTRSKANVH